MTAGRRLSADDRRVWAHVAEQVRPRARAAAPPEPSAVMPAPAAPPVRAKVKSAVTAKPAQPAPRAPGFSGLDGRRETRFRKGQLEIEARLDLHGLTLDRAHIALSHFLHRARDHGLRCVLVITGKGGRLGEGALKRLTPLWLAEPGLAPIIAAVSSAQASHGGAGALYVYLRRKRT